MEKARAAIALEENKERSRKEKLRVLELNELSQHNPLNSSVHNGDSRENR